MRAGLALVGLMWLAPRAAAACSCERERPGPEVVCSADVVFEGTAVRRWLSTHGEEVGDLDEDAATRSTAFAVRRVWRGEPGRRATIVTPREIPACGLRFVVGASYIVFADRRADGTLWAHSCSHTTRVREADGLLAALGEAEVPRTGGGCALGGAGTGGPLALVGLLVRRRRR